MAPPRPVVFRLFVYGSFLSGEPDHGSLAESKPMGPASTQRGYSLHELGATAGLVEGGDGAVVGELYEVSYDVLNACDKKSDHPTLFHRGTVKLEDGSEAHAYLLHADQVRGRRRVRGGDWVRRFEVRKPSERDVGGPLARWSRNRWSS